MLPAVLSAADDSDPLEHQLHRRNSERLSLHAHDDEPPIRPESLDHVRRSVRGVTRTKNNICASDTCEAFAVADDLVSAEVTDQPVPVTVVQHLSAVTLFVRALFPLVLVVTYLFHPLNYLPIE